MPPGILLTMQTANALIIEYTEKLRSAAHLFFLLISHLSSAQHPCFSWRKKPNSPTCFVVGGSERKAPEIHSGKV